MDLSKVKKHIEAFESLKNDIVEAGVAIDGNSVGAILAALVIALKGESRSTTRGLTNAGTAVKVRMSTVGVNDTPALVDDIPMDNPLMSKLLVILMDETGNLDGVYEATREAIEENGYPKSMSISSKKFKKYATRIM